MTPGSMRVPIGRRARCYGDTLRCYAAILSPYNQVRPHGTSVPTSRTPSMTQSNPNPYAAPAAVVADISGNAESAVTRKTLIPLWIKVFGWIFMVMGAVIPLLTIVAAVLGQPASYEIFGLKYRGSPFHPMALVISAIFLSLALSAYGLLFGKSWGLNACLFTGYGGAAICLGTTVYSVSQGSLNLRLELLVHVPYLMKLHKIKPLWPSASAR